MPCKENLPYIQAQDSRLEHIQVRDHYSSRFSSYHNYTCLGPEEGKDLLPIPDALPNCVCYLDQAKILGIVATDYHLTSEVTISPDHQEKSSASKVFLNAIADLDLFGLLLFASGWSLMLIPLTLVNNASNTWNSPKITSMITIGCALLVAFVCYEAKIARLPIIPFRFFKNRTVVCACVIGFFDFVSFYLQVRQIASHKPWIPG